MAKSVPNDSALWSRAKAAAKRKFDVYPSAYANAWAAKWYKSKGSTCKGSKYPKAPNRRGPNPMSPNQKASNAKGRNPKASYSSLWFRSTSRIGLHGAPTPLATPMASHSAT